MADNLEIERKYTLKYLPEDLDKAKVIEIKQGYLLRGPVVRVRKANDDYILTYKSKLSKDDTIVNIEEEFPLDKAGFEHLAGKCDGIVIEKTRYKYPLEASVLPENLRGDKPLIAEIDVFHGVYEGLVFAEVEFPSIEAADAFIPPVWFYKNVSDVKLFSNGYMSAQKSFKKLDYDGYFAGQ